MRKGKIKDQVLIRSVLKELSADRKNDKYILTKASPAQGFLATSGKDGCIYVAASDTVSGKFEGQCRHAVIGAANGAASSGARPECAAITAVLPEHFDERNIKELAREAAEVCRELGISAEGGHTEISDAVSRPVITAEVFGRSEDGVIYSVRDIEPGDDIVITRSIGMEAVSVLIREKREALESRFAPDFLKRAYEYSKNISIVSEAIFAKSCKEKISAMYDLSEGGIFSALWRIADDSGCGLEVDLKSIPIRQETIEICEFFNLNPYQILSGGALLIASKNGEALAEKFEALGTEAAVIGKMNDSNDKIIRNGEDVRYLDKPQIDELFRLF